MSARRLHRNPTSPSMTCTRCSMGSPREPMSCTTRFRPRNACLLHASPIKPRSRPTSGLRPIRASRLVRAPKLQIRGLFTSTCLRNQSALTLTPASGLRNRPFYHTNWPSSLASSQGPNPPNPRPLHLLLLPLEPPSISQAPVTSAAYAVVFSDPITACIAIYERPTSTKGLATVKRSLETLARSGAMPCFGDP